MAAITPTSTGVDYKIDVKVVQHTRAVQVAVWKTCDLFIGKRGIVLRGLMQNNVEPGRGPGPHPHPGRQDTGWAKKSIISRKPKGAGLLSMDPTRYVGAFSDKRKSRTPLATKYNKKTPPDLYLFFLEFGFTSRAGRFFRYPWGGPAVLKSMSIRVGPIKGPGGLTIIGG